MIEKFSIGDNKTLQEDLLVNQSLQDIDSWIARLSQAGLEEQQAQEIGTWLDTTLGTEFTSMPSPATI